MPRGWCNKDGWQIRFRVGTYFVCDVFCFKFLQIKYLRIFDDIIDICVMMRDKVIQCGIIAFEKKTFFGHYSYFRDKWDSSRENLSSVFPTKRDSNQSPQLHLKFRM